MNNNERSGFSDQRSEQSAELRAQSSGEAMTGSANGLVQIEAKKPTLADVRAKLARQALAVGDMIEANAQIDAALKVDDGVILTGGERALVDAEAGAAGGVVGGADDAAGAIVAGGGDGVEVVDDFFFVPDVVAGGEDVGAEVEELVGDRRGEAESAGGVFSVDDDEVDGAALDDVADVLAHDAATGAAEDVADEEDAQWGS